MPIDGQLIVLWLQAAGLERSEEEGVMGAL
jgi:hypothetical protein